jgi:hypothetical protein
MGGLYGVGLDRVETDDERNTGKEFGASGHSGLLGSVIGLEILSVLMVLVVELDRLKLGLRFLFMESVSFVRLVYEKARDLRGRADDLRGGVTKPSRSKSSVSLFVRLSDRITPSCSMLAPTEACEGAWWKAKATHRCYYLVIDVAWTRSESGSSRVRSLRCTCEAGVRGHSRLPTEEVRRVDEHHQSRRAAGPVCAKDGGIAGARCTIEIKYVVALKEATLTCRPATQHARRHPGSHMFQTSSLRASRCLIPIQPSTRWRPPQRCACADTSWGNADRHAKLDMG